MIIFYNTTVLNRAFAGFFPSHSRAAFIFTIGGIIYFASHFIGRGDLDFADKHLRRLSYPPSESFQIGFSRELRVCSELADTWIIKDCGHVGKRDDLPAFGH